MKTILLFFILTTGIFAQTKISVTESVEKSIAVEKLLISVKFEQKGNILDSLNQIVRSQSYKFFEVMQSFSFSKSNIITDNNYLGEPEYNNDEYKYRAENSYSFYLHNLENYETLKDTLIKIGAKSFDISSKYSSKKESAIDELYKEALIKAEKRARTLAQLQKYSEIIPIEISDTYNVYKYDEDVSEDVNYAPISIIRYNNTITDLFIVLKISVRVVYELR